MKKEEIESLKKIAEFCLKNTADFRLNYGAGPFIVLDGTDHKIADVYSGMFNETPMDVMQTLCVANNHIHQLSEGILKLIKYANN